MQRKTLILLVEDDADTREAWAVMLQKQFCVLTAATFKEAVHKILSLSALDAIVTDYDLPDGSGLEVRKLAHLKGLPILLISGDCTVGRSYQPFLAKPFTGEALQAAVYSIGGAATSIGHRRKSRPSNFPDQKAAP